MSLFNKIKEKASESRWCAVPYRGFVIGSPTSTYNEIVSLAFDDVNNTCRHAKHSRYDEMYHPHLGSFRERKMFTTLAPSLCIPKRNRSCSYDLVPHKAYSTKQGEWLVERDRNHRVMIRRTARQPCVKPETPGIPTLRRCYTLPTTTTRFENYFRYWRGRICGLDYVAPFLQPPDYRPAEDRRYHRIFWAPEFLPITPSCRHAAGFMLTAY
ncbi:hypothetical protein DICVIV_10056 [Dictyocaulus viviparus]|uniref:Uncharacterized protein n=1 Tax=Dictyocaulus viviparus TaxID=29172 RepID=A0A0D8XGY4_DICVI|nr:hypothetical protein DICVIV_10056 [Dictyocaulus viviparus]